MRTLNYENNASHTQTSENSFLHMEQFERKHIEQYFQSTSEPLSCWGEEPNFQDSEFSMVLERVNQGNLGWKKL